jgi:hypothetical protein
MSSRVPSGVPKPDMTPAQRLMALVTVVACLIGVHSVWRVTNAGAREPKALTHVEGLTLRASYFAGVPPAWAVGAKVLYVFTTTCRYCEGQRAHMGGLLAQLPGEAVITASVEDTALTRNYWKAVGIDLPEPAQLDVRGLEQLGVTGVPAILIVDSNDVVVRAYLGTSRGWTVRRMRRELANAGPIQHVYQERHSQLRNSR